MMYFVAAMKILQFLLWPFVPLYALAIRFWRWLYSAGIWGSTKFSIPVISVGNLQAGGTGKSPVVAWLAEQLSADFQVGILSRGYKRLTFGFRMAQPGDTYREIGDEPAWHARRVPQAALAVGENRIEGIPNMLSQRPDVEVVILDDAYQQLGIRPAVNILLTTFYRPYSRDALLPLGRLREPAAEQSRADIIIVTYCPAEALAHKAKTLRMLDIHPEPHQKAFLCSVRYTSPYHLLYEGDFKTLKRTETILLVTGIADATPLLDYLHSKGLEVHHLKYRDHHRYIESDIENIARNKTALEKKQPVVILSTEKDATRLLYVRDALQKYRLDIYIQPMYLDWGKEEALLLESVKDIIQSEMQPDAS
jgi:tetraacyldisaccharide 4'-kinase